MPRLSACIPTHNRASDLAARLEELAQQTLRDIEVVVLDDGSSDETPQVVGAAAARDARIRHVRVDPPVGVPEIVARCFHEARADVVALVHDHDSYHPSALERLLAALETDPEATFAFCGIRTIDPQSGDVVDISADPLMPAMRRDVTETFVRTGNSVVGASAVIVRKRCVPEPVFDAEMAFFADVDLWCRLNMAGPAGYVPGPLVDVMGWAPQEGLTKLDWAAIGQLGRLRLRYAGDVARNRWVAAVYPAWIRAATLSRRLRWIAQVLRSAWRGEYTPTSTRHGPRLVSLAARLTARVAGSGTTLGF